MSILYHMYIQLRFIYRFHVDNIDLGKSLLEHAKVQVTRELQFLEDVNCVTLRREADAESSRRLEEQQQQYFYFSKPDPILRNFVLFQLNNTVSKTFKNFISLCSFN